MSEMENEYLEPIEPFTGSTKIKIKVVSQPNDSEFGEGQKDFTSGLKDFTTPKPLPKIPQSKLDFTGKTTTFNVLDGGKSRYNTSLNDLGLNKNQIAFVKAYIRNPSDPSSAYLACYKGVKRSSAKSLVYTLLKKHAIREAIARQIFLETQLSKIDKVFVVKTLKELAMRCVADDDRKYLIESLDMMNKLAGFYAENKNPSVQINTNQISFGGWNPDTNTDAQIPIEGKIHPETLDFEESKEDIESDIEDIDEEIDSEDFEERDSGDDEINDSLPF